MEYPMPGSAAEAETNACMISLPPVHFLSREDKISDTIIPKLYLIIKCFAEKRLQKSFYA